MSMQMKLMDPYLLMVDSGVVITGADAGMSGMLRMRAADVVATSKSMGSGYGSIWDRVGHALQQLAILVAVRRLLRGGETEDGGEAEYGDEGKLDELIRDFWKDSDQLSVERLLESQFNMSGIPHGVFSDDSEGFMSRGRDTLIHLFLKGIVGPKDVGKEEVRGLVSELRTGNLDRRDRCTQIWDRLHDASTTTEELPYLLDEACFIDCSWITCPEDGDVFITTYR